MRQSDSKLKTIVVATMVMVFVLFSSFSGTYAWFVSMTSREAEVATFQTMSLDVELESISLYKFDYEKIQGTRLINYLAPERGGVNHYPWVAGEGRNQFGVLDGNDFTPVSAMNVYDPVSILIRASDLRGLNCNAIFKITIKAPMETGGLKVYANHLIEKEKLQNELFLTDMVDFDLFLEEDLEDQRLSDVDRNGKPLYYPSYISKNTQLTDDESLYYKFSYLSSLNNTHAHFYGGNSKPDQIEINNPARTIAFDNEGIADVYINVNYAPSQLTSYATRLSDDNIKAVFDYSLSLSVE